MDVKSNLKKVCTCPNCGADMKIINDGSTSYYVCSECGCSIYAEDQN